MQGGDINLNAGYKTTDNKTTTSGNSFGVGASASVGWQGDPQANVTGSFNLSGGNASSSSTTAIDTVVNGTNSVTMNNKNGNLALNGAQITNKTQDGKISDGSITINTGNLNITTPQNTSKYDSTTVSGGLNASVPFLGSNYTNINPNAGYKGIHNDYQSTGETMSGLYAGKGGLDVNVGGTTTLTAGAMNSAAAISHSLLRINYSLRIKIWCRSIKMMWCINQKIKQTQHIKTHVIHKGRQIILTIIPPLCKIQHLMGIRL